MTTCSHIILMASYNEWMNEKLYEAAGRLSRQELAADKKAPFRSLIGILNHIIVGDTLWLKRFAAHPANHAALDPIRQLPMPSSLDQVLFDNLGEMLTHRRMLDKVTNQWANALHEEDLQSVLHYASIKGVPAEKRFSSLVLHFFNHQTHHRGQATTLLFQADVDIGVTDLLALIPNESKPA